MPVTRQNSQTRGAVTAPAPAPSSAPRAEGAPSPSPAPSPKASRKDGDAYEYRPSEATLRQLSRLPADRIKDMLGFDINYLKEHTRKYGVLEALAWGRWTPPIKVANRWNRQSQFISCRIWQVDDPKEGYKWGVEDAFPVMTRRVIGKDGVDKTVYDRNDIHLDEKCHSEIMYDGKPLSREQVTRLKLTGHLGDPVTRIGYNGKPVTEMLQVHPYNRQRLIAVSCDTVRARLLRDPVFKTKEQTYKLTERQIGELSLGRGVWVGGNDGGGSRYIQYDSFEGKLCIATEYGKALREYNSERFRAAEAKAEAQSMGRDRAEGMNTAGGPRP